MRGKSERRREAARQYFSGGISSATEDTEDTEEETLG
jgi:hypothetical protein